MNLRFIYRFSFQAYFLLSMVKTLLNWVWLVALCIFPFALWYLPADFFDSEDGPILCPSRLFFDIECLGCGMTRAVMHLHHFEWDEAIYFNMGVIAIYPGLILLWFIWTRNTARRLGLLSISSK